MGLNHTYVTARGTLCHREANTQLFYPVNKHNQYEKRSYKWKDRYIYLIPL